MITPAKMQGTIQTCFQSITARSPSPVVFIATSLPMIWAPTALRDEYEETLSLATDLGGRRVIHIDLPVTKKKS